MLAQSIKPSYFKAVVAPNIKDAMLAYIQGAVYCWCKNSPDRNAPVPNQPNHFMSLWFDAPTLFGGTNFDWDGTPIYELYDYWYNQGASNPVLAAGLDVGNLLKEVITNDKRTFNTRKINTNAREYQWIGI